ncbi:hypothetical protein ACET3Z_015179 [Daucus carota]
MKGVYGVDNKSHAAYYAYAESMDKMCKSSLFDLSYWKMLVSVLMLLTIVVGAEKSCGASRCRDGGPNIHFPFWLKQNSSTSQPTDDCAYLPGFQLSCAVITTRRGEQHLYDKDDTLVEFKHIVNTSNKGIQLSFKYKAVVIFIDYRYQYMLLDPPFLVDIVPSSVVTNFSSTPHPLGTYTFDDIDICYQPFYCYGETYEVFNYDPFGSCLWINSYQQYTFFNCSSASAVIEFNGNTIINSLSTGDFKIYAYSSDQNMITMLDNIRSCKKMYDISTKLPQFSPSCTSPDNYFGGKGDILSWSTTVGGRKCEGIRERCKISEYDSPTPTSTTTFQASPTGPEQNTSDVYFPEWIFRRLEKNEELVIQIENEDDSKIARKITIVGLWCIGWHPIDRPSMKVVIQMLEADECPAMPPNPFSTPTSGNATHAKSLFGERLQVISEAE